MSKQEHVDYFHKRAQAERELAAAAPADYISNLHLDMAARYDQLALQPKRHDDLTVVGDPSGPEAERA